MEGIFFQIERKLGKYMSKRASLIFSGFGTLALFLLGLWGISLKGFEESSDTLLCLCFVIFSLIPISFIISWIFEIKHAWDMRMVVVDDIDPRLSSFPQNAIYAKKQGFKFRRPTKEEKIKWVKKRKLSTKIKRFLFITQDDLERQKIEEKLYDPDTPTSEFIKIRNEQDNIE